MNNPFLDAFGSMLIRQVRDYTISDWDDHAGGLRKSAAGPQINAALSKMSESERAAIKMVLPGIVDSVLHNMLHLLETEDSIRLILSMNDEESAPLAEISDGLAGEMVSSNGWISRFSSQRHYESR